jgi:hypothetical protein
VGGDAAQTSVGEDGTFTIQTWTLSLLELVRDPGWDRYVFRAEVRHINSGTGGHAGLYCAQRETATVNGSIHLFVHLSFNEVFDAKLSVPDVPQGVPRPPTPKGNTVHLDYRLYRDGGPEVKWDRGINSRGTELFQATGGGSAGPWRTLIVLVTPERIEARWIATPGGAEEAVGALLPAELAKDTLQALDSMRKARPLDTSVEAVRPAFSTRGSLGLHVLNGSASFRNVTVEPLGEAK